MRQATLTPTHKTTAMRKSTSVHHIKLMDLHNQPTCHHKKATYHHNKTTDHHHKRIAQLLNPTCRHKRPTCHHNKTTGHHHKHTVRLLNLTCHHKNPTCRHNRLMECHNKHTAHQLHIAHLVLQVDIGKHALFEDVIRTLLNSIRIFLTVNHHTQAVIHMRVH